MVRDEAGAGRELQDVLLPADKVRCFFGAESASDSANCLIGMSEVRQSASWAVPFFGVDSQPPRSTSIPGPLAALLRNSHISSPAQSDRSQDGIRLFGTTDEDGRDDAPHTIDEGEQEAADRSSMSNNVADTIELNIGPRSGREQDSGSSPIEQSDGRVEEGRSALLESIRDLPLRERAQSLALAAPEEQMVALEMMTPGERKEIITEIDRFTEMQAETEKMQREEQDRWQEVFVEPNMEDLDLLQGLGYTRDEAWKISLVDAYTQKGLSKEKAEEVADARIKSRTRQPVAGLQPRGRMAAPKRMSKVRTFRYV